MKVYYGKDADLSLIKGRKVTIVGFGSQGHAHARNLNESGVKVTVGLRRGGGSWEKAKKAGLAVKDVADAVKGADFVMMLMPDEHIAAVYRGDVEPNIKKGATLGFAHGFNIHYGQVMPRAKRRPESNRATMPRTLSWETAPARPCLSRRRMTAQHPIETVGAKLRDMMPWIRKNRLVDQSKN